MDMIHELEEALSLAQEQMEGQVAAELMEADMATAQEQLAKQQQEVATLRSRCERGAGVGAALQQLARRLPRSCPSAARGRAAARCTSTPGSRRSMRLEASRPAARSRRRAPAPAAQRPHTHAFAGWSRARS